MSEDEIVIIDFLKKCKEKRSEKRVNRIKEMNKRLDEREQEIERLNNIINELEKDMIERYHKEIDYQSKIMQSDLMQGDYPVSYYYAEQNEKLLNYYLNKLQELKGSVRSENMEISSN